MCIDDELDAAREGGLRKRLPPQLLSTRNPVMALCAADCVGGAWNGSATGTRPAALGGAAQDCFSGLARALPPAAVPHLKFLPEDPRPKSVADALQACSLHNVISLYDVDELEDVATRSFASQPPRGVFTARAYCWNGSDMWDWIVVRTGMADSQKAAETRRVPWSSYGVFDSAHARGVSN